MVSTGSMQRCPTADQLVGDTVAELVGIQPDYVLTAGLEGFAAMIDVIGGVSVHSPLAFEDPKYPITVTEGRNDFDGQDAAASLGLGTSFRAATSTGRPTTRRCSRASCCGSSRRRMTSGSWSVAR